MTSSIDFYIFVDMRTIRESVFETNSSTTHCVTISKQFKTVKDVPFRSPSEFPKLNANKELEVEMNIYWDMDVLDKSIDLSSVDTIIKYITAHAVYSSEETLYSRKNHEVINHFDENHENLLHDIQEAYEIIGLEAPVDIKPYFLDENDNKIYITKDNVYHWHTPYSEDSWYNNKKEWKIALNKKIKTIPGSATWPITKYNIGMCGNDLCGYTYNEATYHFENMSNGFDWDRDEKNEDLTTIDMLTKQVTLSFYHT